MRGLDYCSPLCEVSTTLLESYTLHEMAVSNVTAPYVREGSIAIIHRGICRERDAVIYEAGDTEELRQSNELKTTKAEQVSTLA